MTKTIVQTYTIANEHRTGITMTLLIACAVCALFYVFNTYRAISYSMSIQNVSTEIAMVDAKMQNLDSRYVELVSSITPDLVRQYGFENAEVSAFIPRDVSLGFAYGDNGF